MSCIRKPINIVAGEEVLRGLKNKWMNEFVLDVCFKSRGVLWIHMSPRWLSSPWGALPQTKNGVESQKWNQAHMSGDAAGNFEWAELGNFSPIRSCCSWLSHVLWFGGLCLRCPRKIREDSRAAWDWNMVLSWFRAPLCIRDGSAESVGTRCLWIRSLWAAHCPQHSTASLRYTWIWKVVVGPRAVVKVMRDPCNPKGMSWDPDAHLDLPYVAALCQAGQAAAGRGTGGQSPSTEGRPGGLWAWQENNTRLQRRPTLFPHLQVRWLVLITSKVSSVLTF